MALNKAINIKKVAPIVVGSVIATILLIVSLFLDESLFKTFCYPIYFIIGPPILMSLFTDSGLAYLSALYVYFITLIFAAYEIGQKARRLMVVIVLGVHALTVIYLKHVIKAYFRF